MKTIWDFLFSFSKMHVKYLALKDTDDGERSVAFGVMGILYALFAGAFLVLSYFSFVLTKGEGFRPVLGLILLIVASVAVLLFLLHGIYSTTLQLKLNKKAAGFLSLFMQLAAFAGAVVVVLVVNGAA